MTVNNPGLPYENHGAVGSECQYTILNCNKQSDALVRPVDDKEEVKYDKAVHRGKVTREPIKALIGECPTCGFLAELVIELGRRK